MTNSQTSLSAFDYLKLDDLEQIVLTEAQHRRDTNRIADVYPDEGPLRRELYPKHIAFFKAGATHMERAAIAANRVGKTWGIGGYETALHLTGDYPKWWEGRRFNAPVDVWAAGDTSETTRDIVQLALMGPINAIGTGLLPASRIIGDPARRSGTSNAIDTVMVQHQGPDGKPDGISYLGFKSYDQGRRKFQGTGKRVIWLDEEPPADVYDASTAVQNPLTTLPMDHQEEAGLPLDGNAASGLLSELFALDVTVAEVTCDCCGAVTQVGETKVYGGIMGAIFRCAQCDSVVMRLVHTPVGLCLDMRGSRRLLAQPVAR